MTVSPTAILACRICQSARAVYRKPWMKPPAALPSCTADLYSKRHSRRHSERLLQAVCVITHTTIPNRDGAWLQGMTDRLKSFP